MRNLRDRELHRQPATTGKSYAASAGIDGGDGYIVAARTGVA
jgi:hypothetical protein